MFQISRQALFHAKRGVLRASALYQPRVVGCQTVSRWNQRVMSSTAEKVPPEDYYDGHLMADHLEYLDDMLDKTISLEASLEELKDTYAQKKSAMVGGASAAELEALFEKSAFQKENMTRQIEVLKAALKTARSGYAVDAPDGVSDSELCDGVSEVGSIIDFAKEHENKATSETAIKK